IAGETAGLEATIAQASNAIAALNAEHNKQEKAIIGHDLQLQRADDEAARLAQKSAQLVREQRQAQEERESLERRQTEAQASIARLAHDQHTADERVDALRLAAGDHEASIKDARGALEAIRATVAELDVARATAEADLSHLSSSCAETVQATLDEVLADVERLERDGSATPDARVICGEEADD